MQGFNVLIVYNKDMSKILMCERLKSPYKGLSNLVGGKIEPDESGIDAAYRELYEETNISSKDINLYHLMDFTYYMQNIKLEVYVGRLKNDVNVSGDENILYWSDINRNFFDMTLFAGEGNIGHMLEHAKMLKHILYNE